MRRIPFSFSLIAYAVFYTLSGGLVTFVLLTLLHSQFDNPAVQHADWVLQLRIHSWSGPWLTRLMLSLTWIGSIKIFASALAMVLVVLLAERRRHEAGLVGFAMLGALVLNQTLKVHFHRPRPTVAWSIGDEATFSFPSGHSLFSFVLYGTLAYLALRRQVRSRRRVSVLAPAILLPLGIGLSRIYLGMHYPTDVLAGYVTGAVWLAAVVGLDRARRATTQDQSGGHLNGPVADAASAQHANPTNIDANPTTNIARL